MAVKRVHDKRVAATRYQHPLRRSQRQPINPGVAGIREFFCDFPCSGVDDRNIRRHGRHIDQEPVELSVPDGLFHPRGIGKVNLAENAVRVCRNEGELWWVGYVIPDQDDALKRIIRELVGSTICDRITQTNRMGDSWWVHVKVHGLQQAIAIPGPEYVIRAHDHTIGSSPSSIDASSADKPGNPIDVRIVNSIEDEDGCLSHGGKVQSSPIWPRYVDASEASWNRYYTADVDATRCVRRSERLILGHLRSFTQRTNGDRGYLNWLHALSSADYQGQREGQTNEQTAHQFGFHRTSPLASFQPAHSFAGPQIFCVSFRDGWLFPLRL